MNISNEHLNPSFPEVLTNRNDIILLYMGEPIVERIGIGSARETQPTQDRCEYITCVTLRIAALHHGFSNPVLCPFIHFTYSHPGLAHRIQVIDVHGISGTRVFGWVRGSRCNR